MKIAMKRRAFLKGASAAVLLPMIVPERVFGANDRLQVGFIGVGGRARWIMTKEALPGAEIVAVADCYLPRCGEATKLMEGGERWGLYQDYRKLLEKEKVDAVFVETTTHARVRALIHAMQAGCDVYGEKPISLTVAEGRYLVKAVKRYGKVFQTGSQQRSMPINRHASALVRGGAIGRVKTVVTCNFKGPKTWRAKEPEPEPIPEGLDWDHWCNQTELRPYYRELQYGWVDWASYDGGGQVWGVTGWGTHSLDQAQCGLGLDDTGPVDIIPVGSGPDCAVTMRYANGVEIRLEGANRGMEDLGAIFIGDKGKIEILRGDYTADPAELRRDAPPVTPQGDHESIPHISNFFDCIRTRAKTQADVETGHRATTLCHLVNIVRRVQRRLKWDPVAERFEGDAEADGMLSRPRRKGYELPSIA
jgi:glucose-fructose oxidoreductase